MGNGLLVRAVTDTNLLGEHFEGDSWNAWKVLLKSVDGGELSQSEKLLYKQFTNRNSIPTDLRELVLICGRRSGKTRLAGVDSNVSGRSGRIQKLSAET